MHDFVSGMLYGGAVMAIVAFLLLSYKEFEEEEEELIREEEEELWLKYLCEDLSGKEAKR